MFYKIKLFIFYIGKFLGLFWLARKIYRKKLRILCYHGFTMRDEHEFRSGLFIKPDIFARRMQYLADKKYNIITLQEAYDLKEKRNFPDDAIVLTIDDGFYSVVKESLPVFKKHDFPATLYLTSYYFDKECPIFMLAVDYMFFKTTGKNISLEKLAVPGLLSQNDPAAVQKIIEFGTKLDTEDERIDILKKLGDLLDVHYGSLNESRILNLINKSDMTELLEGGIDIQLHTHRHNFPTNNKMASYEIDKNKEKINSLLPEPMAHFCYPSGVWSQNHWPVLEKHGIRTATTCESRLVSYNTPNYGLNRILDSSRVSQIEFEAEVSGFNEIIRKIRCK